MSTFIWQLAALIVSVAVLVFVGFSTAATRAETQDTRVESMVASTTVTYQRLLEDDDQHHFVPGRYPAPWWWRWREVWRRLRGRRTFIGLFIFHRLGHVRQVVALDVCAASVDEAFSVLAYRLGITDQHDPGPGLSASYQGTGYTAYVWALKLDPPRG